MEEMIILSKYICQEFCMSDIFEAKTFEVRTWMVSFAMRD